MTTSTVTMELIERFFIVTTSTVTMELTVRVLFFLTTSTVTMELTVDALYCDDIDCDNVTYCAGSLL